MCAFCLGSDEGDAVWSTWDENECVYLVTVWRGDAEMMLANDAFILKECKNMEMTSSDSQKIVRPMTILCSCVFLRFFCGSVFL